MPPNVAGEGKIRGGEFAVEREGVRGGAVSVPSAAISRPSRGMEPGQTDERLDYLSAYIQKTLKLKPEKWTKMMAQVSCGFSQRSKTSFDLHTN
jgi:hypothetical protein